METTCSCQYIKTDVPVNHNLKRKSELVKSGEFLLDTQLFTTAPACVNNVQI